MVKSLPTQDPEYFHHVKKFLHTPFLSIFFPRSGNHFLIYIIIDFYFAFSLYINNNVCFVCMYVCMYVYKNMAPLLNIFLSFNHFVANN